jgi:hypothetical protein
MAALLVRVHRRVRRLLARRGRSREDDAGSDPFAAQAPLFAQAVTASLQGRVALGPRAGQPVRRLRSAVAVTATGRRSARLEGFSLHADVAVRARRRDQLERLVRYLVRPPLALDRLTESTGGRLLYHFRRPWPDGSTALLLDPLELLERLAALVPRPGGRWWRITGSSRRARAGDRHRSPAIAAQLTGRRRHARPEALALGSAAPAGVRL